ncbi:hypothetical protein J3458_020048 [Metarhizium acridum]|uniref:uncharacterized protein n=1 Tax=Metarhizium acridum TaxID=92637 RepID=UPI001C6CEA9D|nr:hypothetical protein J3458_020048 [Metarhizium acridum]
MTIDTPNKTGVSQSATFTKQIMDSYDNKITKPDKTQRGVVDWMINAKKGGFDYDTLPSKGSPSQFVTITKQEMEANKVLKDAGWEMVSHSTIDNQVSLPFAI